MAATTATMDFAPAPKSPIGVTLLDLVSALTDTGATDREVVAAVLDLVHTGHVKLVGEICEQHLFAATTRQGA